jgi:type II secretory pathway pseudopilin PulG
MIQSRSIMISHRSVVPRRQRRGFLLICVLTCMSVASMMAMVSMKSSIRSRRQMNREAQMDQTIRLLQAGYDRAIDQRNRDPSYTGETWDVSEAFAGMAEAKILIRWPNGSDPPDQLEESDQPVELNQGDERSRLFVQARMKSQDLTAQPTRRTRTWRLNESILSSSARPLAPQRTSNE